MVLATGRPPSAAGARHVSTYQPPSGWATMPSRSTIAAASGSAGRTPPVTGAARTAR
jgi:hypothetical protein